MYAFPLCLLLFVAVLCADRVVQDFALVSALPEHAHIAPRFDCVYLYEVTHFELKHSDAQRVVHLFICSGVATHRTAGPWGFFVCFDSCRVVGRV